MKNTRKPVIKPWEKCTFSNKPEYKNMTVTDVYQIDSFYIKWCVKNLNHFSWTFVKKYLIEND